MPRCTVPASPSTNTFASTLRTPSTKATVAKGASPEAGRIGRHAEASASAHGSTAAVPSTSPMASVGLPYSGAHDSTAKCTGPLPVDPLDGRPCGGLGDLEAHG